MWRSMSSDEGGIEGGTFQRKPSFFGENDQWGDAEDAIGPSAETTTMSHAKSIASIHAQSRQRSPSHLVFSMHNGIDGSISDVGGSRARDSILTNRAGVAGGSPPAPTRKQLSMRARRASNNVGASRQVLNEFTSANNLVRGSDVSASGNEMNTRRGRTSSGVSDRSRSSSGLSAGGGSERPRVARLHSQLTAAALRDRNMGTSNAVLFSQSAMFSTREYESSSEDDSDDGGLRNAVMF